MTGDLAGGVQHAHLALGDQHRDALADEPPGDAVAVGVELDAGVGVHAPAEFAHLHERRLRRERRERGAFAALEARRDKTCALKQAMMQELLTGRMRLVKPEAIHA